MDDLRIQIDGIDRQIIQLLGKRMDLVKEIGQLKKASGSDIKNDEREEEVRKNLKSIGEKHGLDPEFVNHLYTHIFIESRRMQSKS